MAVMDREQWTGGGRRLLHSILNRPDRAHLWIRAKVMVARLEGSANLDIPYIQTQVLQRHYINSGTCFRSKHI